MKGYIIEYPRLTREQNRSCKLTDEQIAEIKYLREQNWSFIKIARKFNVCDKTIRYWAGDPKNASTRENKLKIDAVRKKILWETDPEYRAHSRQLQRVATRILRQRPEIKAYNKARSQTPKNRAYMKAYRQTPEHKAYMKAYMKAYRQTPEHKAYMKAYLKAYRQKNKKKLG